MAINASATVVRDMKKTLESTEKSIQQVQQALKNAMSSTSNWNDSQGEQYKALMKKIAALTQSPMTTLHSAAPKLEQLARALDHYGKVKIH